MKLSRPLISIDLETTGVDVKEDRVVQLAFVRLDTDGELTQKSRIINPGRPIPKEATAVHGIGNDDVDGHPRFEQVAKSLHRLLSDCDLTGYNLRSFDVPMLAAEFARCDLSWPAEDQRVVDAFEIFKRQEPHKLAQALKFYTGEILGDDAHDALADARAALDVLVAQAMCYGTVESPGRPIREVGEVDLDALGELARDPDWIDSTGKAKWDGDTAVINFGKWQGKPLQQVEPSYFSWVLKQDFPDDFNAICEAAKVGKFPTRGCL